MSGEFGFGEVVGQRVRRDGDGMGAAGVRARSVPEAMAVRNMRVAVAQPMLDCGHSG